MQKAKAAQAAELAAKARADLQAAAERSAADAATARSSSSVGISFNKSTILGLNVDLFEFEMVEKEG